MRCDEPGHQIHFQANTALPRADGLVKWFNQTLRMLQKFVDNTRKDLDCWLPLLFCAHTKVPHASTLFLSFCMARMYRDYWIFSGKARRPLLPVTVAEGLAVCAGDEGATGKTPGGSAGQPTWGPKQPEDPVWVSIANSLDILTSSPAKRFCLSLPHFNYLSWYFFFL